MKNTRLVVILSIFVILVGGAAAYYKYYYSGSISKQSAESNIDTPPSFDLTTSGFGEKLKGLSGDVGFGNEIQLPVVLIRPGNDTLGLYNDSTIASTITPGKNLFFTTDQISVAEIIKSIQPLKAGAKNFDSNEVLVAYYSPVKNSSPVEEGADDDSNNFIVYPGEEGVPGQEIIKQKNFVPLRDKRFSIPAYRTFIIYSKQQTKIFNAKIKSPSLAPVGTPSDAEIDDFMNALDPAINATKKDKWILIGAPSVRSICVLAERDQDHIDAVHLQSGTFAFGSNSFGDILAGSPCPDDSFRSAWIHVIKDIPADRICNNNGTCEAPRGETLTNCHADCVTKAAAVTCGPGEKKMPNFTCKNVMYGKDGCVDGVTVIIADSNGKYFKNGNEACYEILGTSCLSIFQDKGGTLSCLISSNCNTTVASADNSSNYASVMGVDSLGLNDRKSLTDRKSLNDRNDIITENDYEIKNSAATNYAAKYSATVAVCKTKCGDNVCNDKETFSNCPADCIGAVKNPADIGKQILNIGNQVKVPINGGDPIPVEKNPGAVQPNPADFVPWK